MAKDNMIIVAYSSNEYNTSDVISTTVVLINPSSYTHNHSVNYDKTIPQGGAGTPLNFKGIAPETISFDIYFDSTGAIEYSSVPVSTQIELFKSTCIYYNGTIHEPNYLIISWGTLVFKCKLTSLNISYTLFQPDGMPLRAKASVTFEEALDSSLISQDANNMSPDLTHSIVFKKGDNLPLLCNKIYGDSLYYLDVAKYNNITNFRTIMPGTKLHLPPIK
ncbi:MAG TPA: hypothetical protein VNW06_07150 [Cytophagaceae bacterium]|jgi:nucleoid-associated protein YgaU|nr:hypothetical protein [Cytophagaceae bacterium]